MVLSAGSVAGAASLLRETISLKLASGPARPGSARPSHDEPGDDSNIGPKLQGPGRDRTQTSLSCRIPSFANSRRPAAPLSASRRKGMEHRLNPQALRALTLLIAESAPAGTDLIIRLIVNFAASSSGHASALKSTPKTDWPHCAHETSRPNSTAGFSTGLSCPYRRTNTGLRGLAGVDEVERVPGAAGLSHAVAAIVRVVPAVGAPRRQARLFGRASVIDGDSLRLAGRQVGIHGIDAPEPRQTCVAGGKRWRYGDSRAQSADYPPLTCEKKDRDRHGRKVAVGCTVISMRKGVGFRSLEFGGHTLGRVQDERSRCISRLFSYAAAFRYRPQLLCHSLLRIVSNRDTETGR